LLSPLQTPAKGPLVRRLAQDAPHAARRDEGSGRADHRERGVRRGACVVHGESVSKSQKVKKAKNENLVFKVGAAAGTNFLEL